MQMASQPALRGNPGASASDTGGTGSTSGKEPPLAKRKLNSGFADFYGDAFGDNQVTTSTPSGWFVVARV